MEKVTLSRWEFDLIVENIQKALDVCERVDYRVDAECDNTPPFAVGWTKATLKNLMIDLNRILEDNNVR
jgi:hypothetical protein